MSHKTFTCKICKEEVTKPKSFAMVDDKGRPTGERACRIHEEAQASRAELLKQEQSAIESRARKQKEQEERMFSRVGGDYKFNLRNPRSFCWHCDGDGVQESDYMLRILVIMSKLKERGIDANIFFPNEEFRQAVREEFANKKILKFFPIEREIPDWKMKQLLHPRHRFFDSLVGMLRGMFLCLECSRGFKFNWNWNKPDVSLEVAATFSALIQPDIDAIAKTEVAIEDMVKRNTASPT